MNANSAATVIVSLLSFLSFTQQEGPAQGFLLLKGSCWGGFRLWVSVKCLETILTVTEAVSIKRN